MQNLKFLASLYSWAGQFESYLVRNLKDRFSHDVAHTVPVSEICHSTNNLTLDKW